MTFLQEITDRFPIRKTAEQKEAFLKYASAVARKLGYTCRVEENGHNRNWVAGDPEHANILFTAHYDTPANKLIPHPVIPRNIPLFYLYQLGIVLLLFGLSFLAGWLAYLITHVSAVTLVVFLLAYYALLMLLVMGPANKHNVNCNTSGVAALLQLMAQLPPETRDQAAFILFDNGERGKSGSRSYALHHQEIKRRTPVFNMDCVGVGNHLLIIAKMHARAAADFSRLLECFPKDGEISPVFFPANACVFNSDHQSFRCGMTALFCKRRSLIGYYTPGLHTRRDTQASQQNLDYLTGSLTAFVQYLADS